jgi:branched-chain amino acid aminotransferase
MGLNYVFINDAFVKAENAALFIADLSIQRGYGIFDFFKTVNGKPLFLKDHIARFYHSAAKMHLDITHSPAQLEELLYALMEKNDIPDSGIRITLTGGYATDGYTLASPNLIITQQPLSIQLVMDPVGISLVTYGYQRQLAEMKTLDYLMAIWLQPFIKEQHADDVLYHAGGLVKECPRANFFIISQDNEILTAKNHVLKGVTRKNILKIGHPDFNVEEKDFSLEDLRNAREAFITSTTKHILPVVKIDGQLIGDGKPGLLTTRLAALFLDHVRQQL